MKVTGFLKGHIRRSPKIDMAPLSPQGASTVESHRMEELLDLQQVIMAEEEDHASASQHAAKRGRHAWRPRCTTIRCVCIVVASAVLACLVGWVLCYNGVETEDIPEGEIPSDGSFLLHLGGSCFGKNLLDADPKVGEIVLQMEFPVRQGSNSWWSSGKLYFLTFDDQHWEWAKRDWNVTFWMEKVQNANTCLELSSNSSWFGTQLEDRLRGTSRFEVGLSVNERSAHHWNFALLGLNLVRNNSLRMPVKYKVLALNALSSWGAGSRDLSRSCPFEVSEIIKEELVKITAGSHSLYSWKRDSADYRQRSSWGKNYESEERIRLVGQTCIRER